MIHLGMNLFLSQLGARRQLRPASRSPQFLDNLNCLADTQNETVAHPDAMNYLLEKLPPDNLGDLAYKMTHALVRGKVFDKYRLDGDILIAVDGVNALSQSHKVDPKVPCLEQHRSDGTTYLYNALEVKIVSHTGLAIHLATVFIDFTEPGATKQDCERKAFYRLEKILKKRFGRANICLLMDGLYATQQVFTICNRNNWSYMISLKEGSLPLLWKEAQRQLARHPNNVATHIDDNQSVQTINWVHNLEHEGHITHALFCDQINPDGTEYRFAWVTDYRPNANNAAKLVNKGGRQRWQIEESFNEQKNGGYELEHAYGTKKFAWKNYYYLLQIAHTIMQLILHGDLFAKLQTRIDPKSKTTSVIGFYESIKAFIRRLAEMFRCVTFTEIALDNSFPRSIQIRLDSG
jgi:hypothetical protein